MDKAIHIITANTTKFTPKLSQQNSASSLTSEFQCKAGVVRQQTTNCNSSRSGEIFVIGERHSGTNWVVDIIKKNLKQKRQMIQRDSKGHGWKHGFLPPKGTGRAFKEDEVRLVITRDVFSWLPKMKIDVYEPLMDPKRNLNFSAFIRSEYVCLCMPYNDKQCMEHNKLNDWKYKRHEKNAPNGTIISLYYDKVPGNVVPFEKAENIIQVWTMIFVCFHIMQR